MQRAGERLEAAADGGDHGVPRGEAQAGVGGVEIPVARKGMAEVRLRVHRVERIDAVLFGKVDDETGPRSHLDAGQREAAILSHGARLLGHADERLRIPGLDLPQIPGEVFDQVQFSRDGRAFATGPDARCNRGGRSGP